MDADNGGVDHLDSGIVGSSKCVYDAAPDTSPPPTDEAERKTQKMPLRIRRSFTRGTPRGLFGNIGLMAAHSQSASS